MEQPPQGAGSTLRSLTQKAIAEQKDAWHVVQVFPEISPPRALRIGSNPTVIGRCDVSVPPDRRMSWRHCVLQARPEGVLLRDLGSSNGTFVDRARVTELTLGANAIIRCGDCVFVLVSGLPQSEPDDLGLVGNSHALASIRNLIRRVAPSQLPVLIEGRTGTGKELIAHALHTRSGRGGRLVPINCAALPPSLVESALFGHRRGAFTGATGDNEGAFRAAHGGTLFLDEIGDLALEVQPKLLRALESGEVTPVGGTTPLRVDVRIVAATHVRLDQAVAAGNFREDLYGRLEGVRIVPPALAQRREDVLPLLRSFLAPPLQRALATADFVEALLLHPWPRNVRELRQFAHRLGVLHPDASALDLGVLDAEMQAAVVHRPEPAVVSVVESADIGPPDRARVLELLAQHGGNISELARHVGRSRKQIYRWMAQHDIDRGVGRSEGA